MDPHDGVPASPSEEDEPAEETLALQPAAPAALLRELHGDPSREGNRNVILLVEPDSGVRTLCIRMLSQIFPGYTIDAVEGDAASIEKIRGDASLQIAMIIDFDDEGGSTLSLVRADTEGHLVCSRNDRDTGFLKVPIVLTPKYAYGDDAFFRNLLKEATVDGLVEKPFDRKSFEEILRASIQKRLGVFKDMEADSREIVLSDFMEHVSSLLPYLKKAVLGLSFYSDEEEDTSASQAGDAKVVYNSLNGLEAVFSELQALGPGLDNASLSKLTHDMNNKITPAVVLIKIMLDDDYGLNEQDRANLSQLDHQISSLINYIRAIMSAYKGESGTWSAIRSGNIPIMPKGQELVLPKGGRVCVVDDEQAVRMACSRLIKHAGGIAYEVDDRGLMEMIGAEPPEAVDVFLLDHNLSDTVKGHQLIGLIRAIWPEALIIAHTSEANALNRDPANPYKAVRVEIVGKLDTRAMSGIIKRKLLKRQETPPAV